MKSPQQPPYTRRSSTSGSSSTATNLLPPYSPAYSQPSVVKKKRSPAAEAVRSVVGIFASCFTPPEPEGSRSFGFDHEMEATEMLLSTDLSFCSFSVSSHTSGSSAGKRRMHTKREPGSMKFTIEEIYRATKQFSPSFKIGQGGFGTVYKGKLDDGTVVAIKRAKKSVYDKHLGMEFLSEVRTLEQIEHLNLVKFFGYLQQEDEKILVVEYVPNGTLREHLDCIHGSVLDLSVRLDIAIDVAHAITYLHMYTDHPIIHRDIKSSNILLTEKCRAKVADFGFARLAADADSGATHVSTQVKGTAGYLDPEYLQTYQLTEKSDVYSFGVLLIEIVSSRRPVEPKREPKERITTRWAMKKFSEGTASSILDPKLEHNDANHLVLEKVLELALLQCLAPRRQNRPSMRKCAEILWSIRKDYKELSALEMPSLLSWNSQGSTE
ncbi:Calmodulin-binding receptor-like cytoplasmic kinase 2 [Linum perenne]